MRFINLALVLLFSTGLGFSQEKGGQIEFRTLALSRLKFPELWVIESGNPLPITFPSAQPSLPFKADRTSPFGIFKGPLGDKGKPSDTKPTLVSLPASSSILLLGWMDGEKPGFLAIEDPYATMKSDDWLVINPTKSQIAVQIGASAKPIAVNANSNLTFKNSAPAGTGAAVTIASKQADGSWKAFYTTYWPIYNDMRGMIVVSQKGERLSVNYIADKIGATPPPKP